MLRPLIPVSDIDIENHINNISNPHDVTKDQVGLGINDDVEFNSVTVNGQTVVDSNQLFYGDGSNLTNLNASNLASGTVPDARISQSSVTQHESAITITESQISDLQNYALVGHSHTSGDITDFNEAVSDQVGSMVSGNTETGISVTYDDADNTLDFSVTLSPFTTDDLSEGSSNLYYTDERVDDRVNTLIQNGTGISWTYDDGNGTLTPTISLSPFNIDSLNDVESINYNAGQVLRADGSKYVSATLNTSDLNNDNNYAKTDAAQTFTKHQTFDEGLSTAQGSLPAQLNPKPLSQAIHLTAASSGSNGIKVLDDPEVNMGTNDFTLHWEGALPDYAPDGNVRIYTKIQDGTNRMYFYVSNDGSLRLFAQSGGDILSGSALVSTKSLSLVDYAAGKISIAVERETETTDGTCTLYVSGIQFGDVITIPAASQINLDNAGVVNWLGDNDTGERFESATSTALIYNRALTASEVLDLHVNGVSFADKWGSQVAGGYVTNGDGGDTAGWDTTSAVKTFESLSGEFHLVADGTGAAQAEQVIPDQVGGSFYELSCVIRAPSTNTVDNLGQMGVSNGAVNNVSESNSSEDENNRLSVVYQAGVGNNGVKIFVKAAVPGQNAADNDEIFFDDVQVKRLGATLALEPESIQPAPGQWLDSAHGNHALMPPEGATLTRPENRFRVQWEHTWDGTHEAQFIGGTDQNILPENAYIEYIIAEIIDDGSVQDFTIGDGSDGDRFVALTSGISAGVTTLALANRTHDGTNRKMTIDPDANAQMTIKLTIVGFLLEN